MWAKGSRIQPTLFFFIDSCQIQILLKKHWSKGLSLFFVNESLPFLCYFALYNSFLCLWDRFLARGNEKNRIIERIALYA